MKSRWSDRDAEAAVARYGAQDLGLRIYTTRLLGGDPRLVLHGGGNTSVKGAARDTAGDRVDVLRVKGSGWDMAGIEPGGLPALRLDPLRRLRALDALSDEEMVAAHRASLLDPAAPDPSVETLLHAFLPHKFVDHTHADAILALTDQPDGEAICADVFGSRAAVVPYVMPGFALACACAEAHAARPGVEGLILLKHGIFTFGETARESYERMIGLVTLAESRLARGRGRPARNAARPADAAPAAAVAPILRGLAAGGGERPARAILEFRSSPELLACLDATHIARDALAGPVTPDHVIRTKPKPLILPTPRAGALDEFAAAAKQAVAAFAADYRAYFERNDARRPGRRRMLDAMPRVVLLPGLGLFGLGPSRRAARIAADLAETSARVVADARAIGRFESIPEADVFDIEYWSLEQAKLGKAAAKPLAGQVAAITGGASGIGRAAAAAFRDAGAEIAILDRDADGARRAAAELDGAAIACDVTRPGQVTAAFARLCETFGGVDILLSNAGAAWRGPIGEVAESVLRESFELNFYGHQRAAQAAVAVMRTQGTGGVLLFNVSKQAVNPGRDFGPYGLAKAATLFLMRQYALEHGPDGIRANAVNADRVRTELLDDALIAERAKARGVSVDDYMAGNLLGREVTAADVARAFVDLARAEKTTGAVMTVDGGNVAAMLR